MADDFTSELTNAILPYDSKINKCVVVCNIECADARGTSKPKDQAMEIIRQRYRKEGILVLFSPMNVAGSFITKDQITDLEKMVDKDIKRRLSEFIMRRVDVSFQIYITGHGNVHPREGVANVNHYLDIEVRDTKSVTNCGMRHMPALADNIEKRIMDTVKKKGKVIFDIGLPGNVRRYVVKNFEGLRGMMQDVYNHNGGPGSWAFHMGDITSHSHRQMLILEDEMKKNHILGSLKPSIFCGVENYLTHTFYPTHGKSDGKKPARGILDEVFAEYSSLIKNNPEMLNGAEHSAVQQPVLGLIYQSGMQLANPKESAYNFLLNPCPYANEIFGLFGPNRVFNISGANISNALKLIMQPNTFSFDYGVCNLGLTVWPILTESPTDSMLTIARFTLSNPLTQFDCREKNVKFLPLSVNGNGLFIVEAPKNSIVNDFVISPEMWRITRRKMAAFRQTLPGKIPIAPCENKGTSCPCGMVIK